IPAMAVAAPSGLSSPVLTVLIGICVALIVYEYWFRSQRYVKMANKIPGPITLPILGNAYMAIGKSPRDIVEYAVNKYSERRDDIVRLFLGTKLVVGLTDARDVEIILGSHVHIQKSDEYALFEPWLGDGLLISKGKRQMEISQENDSPTFHSSILKSFMPVFNKNAQNLIDSFTKELGKTFDVHDYMSGTTVDTLIGNGLNSITDEDNTGFEYATSVMKMCNILHLRHYKMWLRPDFIFKFTKMCAEQSYHLNVIHSLTKQVIKRQKEKFFKGEKKGAQSLYQKALKSTTYNEREGIVEETAPFNYIRDDLDENDENDVGEKRRLAFLDFMIEASQTKGNQLSDDEIKEEVDTIMFEGHDTTAAASSFVLSILGVHHDIQDKVFQELKDIFHDDLYRPITFNDTVQMKYLERVILETLRIYSPVPLIARVVNEDVKLASGDYTLPGGTTVVIAIGLIHRNPKYYPNPDEFDPDNFLPERCQDRPYYAYIPFSAGPRSCVGRKYAMLKLKVLLASVLRRFRTISDKDEKDFKLQADIILKREDGFHIRVEERVV
ncbi:hypothetical protein NQ317_016362, partial [Molorchus minor]